MTGTPQLPGQQQLVDPGPALPPRLRHVTADHYSRIGALQAYLRTWSATVRLVPTPAEDGVLLSWRVGDGWVRQPGPYSNLHHVADDLGIPRAADGTADVVMSGEAVRRLCRQRPVRPSSVEHGEQRTAP